MRYDLAVFDVDGTLADSFPFFIGIQNALARRHGFRVLADHEIQATRDLPPREVMRRVGLPGWKLPFVARSFKRLMRERSDAVPLFDGIGDALARLDEGGLHLAIVTSNAADNVRRVLGETHASRMRHVECGASIHGKKRRLLRVLKAARVPASRAIYIGDQIPDAEAAVGAGMDFGAVAWGYASLASLQRCRPAQVFLQPADLLGLLQAQGQPDSPVIASG